MKTPPQKGMTRAALAKASGTGLETLRFYEQKGLLPRPARTPAGYRVYGPEDLERLQFVRRAQELGFSLTDIKQLMQLTGNIKTPRKKVREIAAARLESIRTKIAALEAMEKALGNLVRQCDGKGALRGCPIAAFVGGTSTRPGGHCHE